MPRQPEKPEPALPETVQGQDTDSKILYLAGVVDRMHEREFRELAHLREHIDGIEDTLTTYLLDPERGAIARIHSIESWKKVAQDKKVLEAADFSMGVKKISAAVITALTVEFLLVVFLSVAHFLGGS